MEKSKFEEAEKTARTIKACNWFINNPKENRSTLLGVYLHDLLLDKDVRSRFLSWVANEKELAEKRFNEI